MNDQIVWTAQVFAMVATAAIMFVVADQLMRLAVTFLLGIGT